MSLLAACLLVLAAQAPPAEPARARQGELVLCGEAFALPEPLARALAGARPHLVLAFDTGSPDPLAASGSRAVRIGLGGEWDPAREREACDALAQCGSAVLAGGTWLDWRILLRPESKATRLEQELRAAWRQGRTLVGAGAGASYLASWTVSTREELNKPARNPHRADPTLVVTGLGLFDGWMVDTSAEAPAGAERLLERLVRFGSSRALYLDGACALVLRDEGRSGEVAGSGTVVVFDLARARRSRGELDEARLALLRAGATARLGPEFEPLAADGTPRPRGAERLLLEPKELAREALARRSEGDWSFAWRPARETNRR